MTRLLEEAIATVVRRPDAQQDELARALLQLAGVEEASYDLSPDEEEADLEASIAAEKSGDFVTDDEVRALWARYGL